MDQKRKRSYKWNLFTNGKFIFWSVILGDPILERELLPRGVQNAWDRKLGSTLAHRNGNSCRLKNFPELDWLELVEQHQNGTPTARNSQERRRKQSNSSHPVRKEQNDPFLYIIELLLNQDFSPLQNICYFTLLFYGCAFASQKSQLTKVESFFT